MDAPVRDKRFKQMPSNSHSIWITQRAQALDEIENTHALVGGTARGRRFTTQQINRAYAVILASQFQGFCRDLHSEAVDHIVGAVTPANLRPALRAEFMLNRQLGKGNPHPGTIGRDFNRLGLVLWDDVRAMDLRNQSRQNLLEELNLWRNAIAHQDFSAPQLAGGTTLSLATVRRWRRACSGLASAFDRVLREHIHGLVGSSPWP